MFMGEVMIKRCVSGVLCISVILICGAFSVEMSTDLNRVKQSLSVNNSSVDSNPTVIIDAGHGGLTNTIH